MPRNEQRWFRLKQQQQLQGSGPTSTPAVESALANNLNLESSIASTEFNQSQANVAKMATEEQPLINLDTALTSGSPSAALTAASPIIGKIQSGFNASKEQIMNSIPPGPARDYALSQLNVQSNAGVSGELANITNNAFSQLAQIGQSTGAFGLQQVGASLNAGNTATSSASPILQANQASKASTMGFLGQIVGGTADVASAGVFGSLASPGGGGASAPGSFGIAQPYQVS